MTDARRSAPDPWFTALARSKAQVEAGQVVPPQPVLHRLRESIARMEAGQSDPAPVPTVSLD